MRRADSASDPASVAATEKRRSAAVRTRLDQWFERQGIRPHIVGEFEDSALLAAFGRSGMGAFRPRTGRMRSY